MTLALRTLATLAFALPAVAAFSADGPASAAQTQPTVALSADSVEFAGVMAVGGKTMVNLYDKQSKQSYWTETGATMGGITVVKYDPSKDEVTIRQNGGVEKNLPLRTGAGVVNAPAGSVPAAAAPEAASPTSTPSTTPISQLSKARQEEEARMLVSDLLEIGMAQRKAYEDAQRRVQNGQPAQAPAPEAASAQGGQQQPIAQPGQTVQSTQPAPAAQ